MKKKLLLIISHKTMENVQGDMGKHCEGCNCGGKKCNCPHHKAVPVCIILIALTFLLGTWGVLGESAVAVIWPVLLLIIGGTKLMASKCSCC